MKRAKGTAKNDISKFSRKKRFFGRMKMEMYYGIKWDNIHAEEFIKILRESVSIMTR